MEEWLASAAFFFCWPFLVWGKTQKPWGEPFPLLLFLWCLDRCLVTKDPTFLCFQVTCATTEFHEQLWQLGAYVLYDLPGGGEKFHEFPWPGYIAWRGFWMLEMWNPTRYHPQWDWKLGNETKMEGQKVKQLQVAIIDGVGFHECWNLMWRAFSWIAQTAVLLIFYLFGSEISLIRTESLGLTAFRTVSFVCLVEALDAYYKLYLQIQKQFCINLCTIIHR